MSNIYIQEPPTDGKVLLKTSVGDIDIELWSKEAPKACRNFVQLCMEGYYNGTIFHRVVPKFIVQGGDPTGSGMGGESVWGKPFKDEFHSRLRFARRGLVCMANAGKHDNGSQFFFTMDAAPDLQNKHTIFGKVAGNTIYNMLKLEECEIGADDRPVYPNKILKSQVLQNPFSDIIPRVVKETKEVAQPKKKKEKATKNFKLLSFGEEAEEDEEETFRAVEVMKTKGKSSHDLLSDKALSSKPALDVDTSAPGTLEMQEDSDEEEEDSEAVKESIRNKLKKKGSPSSKDRKDTNRDDKSLSQPADRIADLKKLIKESEKTKNKDSDHSKSRDSDKSRHKDGDKRSSGKHVEHEDDHDDGYERHDDQQNAAAVEEEFKSPEGSSKKKKKKEKKSKKEEAPPEDVPEGSRIEQLQREAKELRKELMKMKEKEKGKSDAVPTDDKKKSDDEEEDMEEDGNPQEVPDLMSSFKAERKKYKEIRKTQVKKGSAREEATLAILNKFKDKLKTAQEMYGDGEIEEGEVNEEGEDAEEEDEENPTSFRWLSHKLKFDESDQAKKAKDANVEQLDWYEIHDPRNPINKRRREQSKKDAKAKRKR